MLRTLAGIPFDPLALMLSFFIANLASGVIKVDMASLMVVPTMIILMHARVITCGLAVLTSFGTAAALYVYYPDAFYLLIIYSFFYLALVMKSQVERSLDGKKR